MSKRIYWGKFFPKMTVQKQRNFCTNNDGGRPYWFDEYLVESDRFPEQPVIPKHLVINGSAGDIFWKNVAYFAIPLRLKRPVLFFLNKAYKKLLNEIQRLEKNYGNILYAIVLDADSGAKCFTVMPISLTELNKSKEQIEELLQQLLLDTAPRSKRNQMVETTFMIKTGCTNMN